MSEQVRQIAMRIKELRELSDCSVAEVAKATEVSEEDAREIIMHMEGEEGKA